MANAWGLAWGSAWGVSWGADAAPPAVSGGGAQDPGFWTEQHRKIKEQVERVAEVAAPITPLAEIPEVIVAPTWTEDDDLEEILELMEIVEHARY